jgi:hypothetical protein
MRALALVLLSLLASLPARASPGAQFADAFLAFQQAREGRDNRIEPAIAAFEALAKAEPANPVYAAYLGSAISLKGREAWMPWNKMKFAEQGLDHVDRALASLRPEHDRQLLRGVPASLETRFVAANLFLALPDGIFHRRAAGRKLLEAMLKEPALAGAPEPFRASVLKAAAQAAGDR